MTADDREDIYADWYLLDSHGYLSVLQLLGCKSCGASGWGYVRMDGVEEDRLLHDACPNCREFQLTILTYRGGEG
jgi:hypothetical protein